MGTRLCTRFSNLPAPLLYRTALMLRFLHRLFSYRCLTRTSLPHLPVKLVVLWGSSRQGESLTIHLFGFSTLTGFFFLLLASWCNCGNSATYPVLPPIGMDTASNCDYAVLPTSTINPVLPPTQLVATPTCEIDAPRLTGYSPTRSAFYY